MTARGAMYLPGLKPGSVSWTIYQDFASAIRERGLAFEIWTDRPTGETTTVPGTRYLEVRPSPLLDRVLAPLTRSQRLFQTIRTVLPHLREDHAPDVLYVEIAYPHATAVDLARRLSGRRISLVIKPTGEDVLSVPEAEYGFPRFRLPRALLRSTLARAEGIRCISTLVLDAVSEWTHAPCRLIPSGVASATIESARRSPERLRSDRAAARDHIGREHGIDGDPLLVALGRLHPFKGLDLAIEALKEIARARLLIVGPSLEVKGFGDYRDWLREHARALGVADRVIFSDPVPHERVPVVLEAADAVLVPSLLESMNKVTIEAVAAGTPVVVTRTTGITDFIEEPGVALVIQPRSAAEIAAAATSVIDGDWKRDPAAGRRFVERFAPEMVAARTVELLREAMAR